MKKVFFFKELVDLFNKKNKEKKIRKKQRGGPFLFMSVG